MSMQKVNEHGLTSVICLIGPPLLLNAVSVPATAYIIRQLGPLGYGQWTVAASLVAFPSFLANLGLRTLFVRFLAQNPDQAETALAEQMGLRMALSVLAGVIALLFCRCLGYPTVVFQCVALTAVALVLSIGAGALGDVLQGFEKFRVFSGINLVAGLTLTGASIGAIWLGAGPVGLSASYLCGPAVSLTLLLVTVRRQLFPVRLRLDPGRSLALLLAVRQLGLQQFLGALQDRIEQLMVPKLVGIAAFGYYSAGAMPAGRLVVFPDGIATAFYPKIARAFSEEEALAPVIVARLLLLSLVICLPLAVLVSAIAAPIAHLLFARRPALCQEIIQITIWSVPLMGLSLPMQYALQAVGRHAQAARAGLWSICGNVACSLFLVFHFGLLGACWCSIVRPALTIVCLLPGFMAAFPTMHRQLPLARIVCCTLLMVSTFGLIQTLPLSAPLLIGLGATGAMLTYSASLLVLKVIPMALIRRSWGNHI